MNSKRVFFINILILLFLANCEKNCCPVEVPSLFDRMNDVTSIDCLHKLGFEKVLGSDIPMFKRNKADTVYLVSLDYDKRTVLQNRWVVSHIEPDSVNVFLNRNNSYLRSTAKMEDELGSNSFFVYNGEKNKIYECTYDSLEKTLTIINYHPIQEK